MGFFNLALLKRNRNPQNSYLALAITPDKVLATVWELSEDNVKVIGFSHKSFKNVDSLIHEAAIAIDNAAQKSEDEVTDVVFGLSSYWMEDGSLSRETSNILKDLSENLELDAQAFVSLASSINHYLKIKESNVQDAVVIGVLGNFTEIHLLGENKVKITKIHKGEATEEKIVQLLHQIKTESQKKLPEKVAVFGISSDSHLGKQLSKIKEEELFTEKIKLDFLGDEELSKSIAFSQAADILGHDPTFEGKTQAVAAVTEVVEPQDDPIDHQKPPKEEIQDDFEFKEGEDVLSAGGDAEVPKEELENLKVPKKQEYAVDVSDAKEIKESNQTQEPEIQSKQKKKSLMESIMTLSYVPKITNIFTSPKSSKKILPIGILLIIVFLVGAFFASLTLVNAEVIIRASSKPYEDSFSVTVAKGASQDTARQRIPGEETAQKVSGTKSTQTTGKKKTGTESKGELKVFNWTTSKVNLEKGLVVITKSGIKFNLDSQIEIASRSASLPGEAVVGVTAEEIGTSGNLDAGADFTFQKYDELLYSGKSNNAFTGGEEKEVTVVAEADQEKLEKELTTELTKQAKDNLKNQLSGQEINDDAIAIQVTNKKFDFSVDEEAGQVKLDLEIEAKALVWDENVLKELLAKIAEENSDSSAFTSKPENVDISNLKSNLNKGTVLLSGDYIANLVPKLNEVELKEKIKGKGQKETKGIILENRDFKDVSFKLSPNFLLFTNLPKNSSKINLTIEAIR